MARKCCVGGCTATSETHQLFLIPKNDNLRSLWLTFLVPTNARLAELNKSQLINKRVCSKHFDKQQFDQEGRRLRYSYPCLFSDLEIALGEPRSNTGWNMLDEHNYFKKQGDLYILEPALNIDKTAVSCPEKPSCSFSKNEKLQVTKDFSPKTFHAQSKNCSESELVEINTLADTVLEQSVQSKFKTYGQSKNYDSKSTLDIQKPSNFTQPSCSYDITTCVNKSNTISAKEIKAVIKKKPISKNRKIAKQIISVSERSFEDSAMRKLQQAKDILASPAIIEKFYAMPKHAQTFIKMQLKNVNKRKMARRFTFDEKWLALSLMKQSPKGYKLLEKMFTLPNKRTLSRLSENINFEPGFNSQIFGFIKQSVKDWDENKKLCSILYDEIALTHTYDENKDEIIGFVDVNGQKKQAYCDHALVFMIRGICASWRQCIAYYFVEGTVAAADLKAILKDVVAQVAETGLIPLALVSDQGSTFRTTIRNLRQDSILSRNMEGLRDDGTIDIAGHQLNVFFDSPHLLKGLRNNFLNEDVLWEGKTATWQDILYVYDIDSKLGHTRALPKLTAHHVDQNKIRKMKVSVAAQVLSARTAAMLKYTNAIRPQSTMTTTAEFVEFADNLFDSVNGYPGGTRKGKLRNAVKKNSAHIKFWSNAIKKLKSTKFIDNASKIAKQSGSPRYIRVPSLEGWITSLESFIRITKLLFEKYDVEYYYPRFINQDPLKNFFGRLRALNYRNVNPNASTFKYSIKSLLLSSVLSPHSRFSNCEDDKGETLIDRSCLFNQQSKESIENKENITPNFDNETLNITSSSQNRPSNIMGEVIYEKMRVHCSAYTAGYICRKMNKALRCKECSKTFTSKNLENIHTYIQIREYKTLKNNNLIYPNETFLRLYRDAAQITHNFLNINCHQRQLGLNLRRKLRSNLYLMANLGCNMHKKEAEILFIKILMRLQVHNWCNIVNRILKGAIAEKYIIKMSVPQSTAFKKYVTYRLRKKCLKK